MSISKKFTLVTEYSENELQEMLEQVIKRIVQAEVKSIVNQAPASEPSSDRLLTRHDLKRILRVSYPTISKLTKEGLLPGKIIGGSYRYKESDLTKFLSSKRTGLSGQIQNKNDRQHHN